VTDERPESLAAQAASWVPPWERAPRPPDREYQAKAIAEHEAAETDEADDAQGGHSDSQAHDAPAYEAHADHAQAQHPQAARTEEAQPGHTVGAAARLEEPADEADDDEPVEQGGLEPLAGESDEPGTVDAPVEVPGHDPAVMDPDVEVPAPIEQAVDEPDEYGTPVDAPLPPDGDDAGDVFDLAADDDVSDDDVDLPFYESPPEYELSGDARSEEEPSEDESDADESDADEPAHDGDSGSAARRVPEEAGTDAPSPLIPAQIAPMDDGELRAALEAILLVVDEPVAELQLAQIVEQPAERVGTMLEDISARYTAAGHGFDLRRAAGGWRLYTRPEYAAYVERFVLDGQSVRLTQAALETLAVVAYKQPVTRSRISAIRGVNCDGVMRTLATRGLIEECGTESETGAHLYRTTGLFLEKLGLDSVDQLPPLAPFLPDDVEEVLDASPG
jgi:segregation and condensation protein B